jgi:putative ABC transport system permease protein
MKRRNSKPPFLADKLFEWYCDNATVEDLRGDMEELFYSDLDHMSASKAKLKYWQQVLSLLFSYAIKKRKQKSSFHQYSSYSINFTMIWNYLKIAFRNLINHKAYTLINVLGLAIGMTSCILLTLYVKDELSYDKDFVEEENIYKVILERKYPGQTKIQAWIPHSFASVFVKDHPEIERATTICGPFNDMIVSYKGSNKTDVKFLENGVFAADSNFFKIFSFKILKGDRKTMLQHPNSMVLTESVAKKYFGDEDALGKLITMSGGVNTVTGICEDPPVNTHFKFGLIISIHSIERFNLDNFNRPDTYCYIKLKEGVNTSKLESKFLKTVDTYAAADFERVNKTSWTDYKRAGNGYRYLLRPLTSIYLDPDNIGGMKASGNIILVRVLIAIAILIFIIACVNFINLATARSSERAKEVGVRKVLGSFKRQLIFQFLSESFIVSAIGVSLTAILIIISLPYFNLLTDKNVQVVFNLQTVFKFLSLIVVLSLLAGIYPSFVLSSFKPIVVLKGNFTATPKGKWIRNGLVVFQFWISISLVICTLVMQQQTKFLSKKDLGYNKEELLVIEGDFHMKPNFTRNLVAEIKRMPEVLSAAGSLSMPSMDGIYLQQYQAEGSEEIRSLHTMEIGDEFAETMDFKLLDGKLFSTTSNDSLSVILNESAVKTLGLSNPIGKHITFIEQTYGSGERTTFKIIGVIKDFNYRTLHETINPLIIQSNEIIFSRMSYVAVRLKPGANAETISQIEFKWKQLSPDMPFQFRFVDNILDAHYQKEQRVGKIFSLFSLLGIAVALIGQFGLSTYTASLRTKEMGIRKVFGAGILDVFILLTHGFTRTVLISFLLAAPTSWYLMERWWLQGFAFRIQINVWTLLGVGVGALAVALVTVGYQSIKAAVVNPTGSLRNE